MLAGIESPPRFETFSGYQIHSHEIEAFLFCRNTQIWTKKNVKKNEKHEFRKNLGVNIATFKRTEKSRIFTDKNSLSQ